MDVLLKSLTQHAATLIIGSFGASLILALICGNLWRKQHRHESKWRSLLLDTRGESLETLLYDHLRERMRMEAKIEALESRMSDSEERLRHSKRYLGLVRYDAFPDVAGSQSFALATYDEQGDGAIISSIVGRNSCRVFCKPLVSGRSERDLSQEEQRAIKEAREGGVRPILSP